MDPFLYKPLFLHLVVIYSLIEAGRSNRDSLKIPLKSKEGNSIFFCCAFLILFLGLRPISWAFGDTVNYAYHYEVLKLGGGEIASDVIFYSIMSWFAQNGFNIHFWFLFVEAIYIVGNSYAVYKLFPYHTRTAMAIVLSSFSFFSYATNGIRNGMACSLFLIALTFMKEKKWFWTIIICFVAFHVHSSLLLPITAILLAHVYHNTKYYFIYWVLCILLSLVLGGFFENLFISQNIIDTGRDSSYFLNDSVNMDKFSIHGFRYDFLLYSCIPIIIGYYFVVIKHFDDDWYKIMLNTYIISNSLWVLVNANWLSNRIAYLSWFMYGYVMIYPFLLSPYIKNRRKKIKLVVLGNIAFTYIMWILGKYV